MELIIKLTAVYLKVLSHISNDLASRKAFKIFQKTMKSKFKPREEQFYASSSYFNLPTSYGNIKCYENGNSSNSTILLVHGWNSNAGSMAGIAKSLVKRNYHVVSFDLPAHGHHPATYTNLRECTAVTKAVIKRLRIEKPISIVSHSFGSLVTSYALQKANRNADKLIFLTSPDTSMGLFNYFKELMSLNEETFEKMVLLGDELLEEPLSGVTVVDKLNQTSYNSLTLIHDRFDKILPHSYSENLKNKLSSTTLYTYENIGHYRMLWNKDVIQKITDTVCEKQVIEPELQLS